MRLAFCLLLIVIVPSTMEYFYLQNLNEHFGVLIVKLDQLKNVKDSDNSFEVTAPRDQRHKSRQQQNGGGGKVRNFKQQSNSFHQQLEDIGSSKRTSGYMQPIEYEQRSGTVHSDQAKQQSPAVNMFLSRSERDNRQYDVPQIECPPAIDGMERFSCPTPDRQGNFHCVDDHVFCDGYFDCPEGEDESSQWCMFYKTTKAHLNVLTETLLKKLRK